MKEEQIKHMVNRFLQWKLPEDFYPDCGISFARVRNAGTSYEHTFEPVGTNLFSAIQAREMIEYMLAERPT